MTWLRDNNTKCDLVGSEFTFEGEDYVVTWDKYPYLRATPLRCPTGLTSHEFTANQLVGKWKPKSQ